MIFFVSLVCCVIPFSSSRQLAASSQPNKLQAGTLCARDERIIFSCPIRRPAKIVSLCGSKNLTSERGYLQYRFGVPEKIELEFPKDRTGTQPKFQYTHRWTEGDVLAWDHIGTLHNAIADYGPDEHRLMKRCQVMADRIFDPAFLTSARR